MADRRDIREAFYGQLESAVSPYLDPSDVSEEYPDTREDLPHLTHRDAERRERWSTGTAPVDVERDGSGNVSALVYSRPHIASFTLTLLDDDEQRKEDTYESLRRAFQRYTLPEVDESDLQTDVHRVTVDAANSNDQTDREPLARGDTMTVNVHYERFFTVDVDHIDSIGTGVDIDGDDIEDITYTTS
jgi:hypothetical protein